jgi:hypothetical protein
VLGRGTGGRAGGAEAGEDLPRSSSAELALVWVWLSMGRGRPRPWEGAAHDLSALGRLRDGAVVLLVPLALAGVGEKLMNMANSFVSPKLLPKAIPSVLIHIGFE